MSVLKRNLVIALSGAVLLTLINKNHNFPSYNAVMGGNPGNESEDIDNLVVSLDASVPPKKSIQWFDSVHRGHGLRMKAHNVRMDKCEFNNCELLQHYLVTEGEEKIYEPLSADAVIFQGCHLGHFLPPLRRDDKQVYVFAERETWWYMGAFERMMDPALNKTEKRKEEKTFAMQMPDILKHPQKYLNILRFRSLFNWTMTYRRDSDIFMPYGEILSRRDAIKNEYVEMTNIDEDKDYDRVYYSKSRDVVWLVSDCETKSKREYYVQRLSKYINVDIYGECGTLSCPKQKYKTDEDNCLKRIIKEYKFILSFENTFHTDYVTEKLFDWFSRDIVQVVYGMADYKSITPSGTVINAADFNSPKELADFMLQVGSDKKKYVKYLQIKDRHYAVGLDEMQQKAYCKLCEKLNNLEANTRTYPNIGLWWQLNDTTGFQKLYLQAFGVYDNLQYRIFRYLFYFLSFFFTCLFLIVTCCLRKQNT